MYPSVRSFVLVSLIALALSIPAFSGDAARLVVKAPDKITKGFPAIIRITAYGPQQVPKMTIFNATFITVTLVSKDNGQEHKIASSIEFLAGPEGKQAMDIRPGSFYSSLVEGEQQSILVDLSLLRPVSLSGVSAGRYNLKVTFPDSKIVSHPVEIEIVDPTETEQTFLKEIRDVGLKKTWGHVDWNAILSRKIPIKGLSLSNLRKETIEQMQFHLLVLNALRGEVSSRKEAEEFPVPGYLQGEKESLLIELDMREDPQKAEQLKKDFVMRHPDLNWLQEVGIGQILWHRDPLQPYQ